MSATTALATLPTVLAALPGAVAVALDAVPPAMLRSVTDAVRAALSVVRNLPARIDALELHRTLPARVRSARFPRSRRSFVISAGVLLLSLGVLAVAVPRGPTEAERIEVHVIANAQRLSMSPTVPDSLGTRDAVSATPGNSTPGNSTSGKGVGF